MIKNKIFQHSQKIPLGIFSSSAQAWSGRMKCLDEKGEEVA